MRTISRLTHAMAYGAVIAGIYCEYTYGHNGDAAVWAACCLFVMLLADLESRAVSRMLDKMIAETQALINKLEKGE